MKYRIFAKIKIEETRLLKKARKIEEIIHPLRELIREFEYFKNGSSMDIEAEQIEINKDKETQTYFYTEINEEIIKKQLTVVENAINPLKEAIEELDKAIIKGITKDIPQE